MTIITISGLPGTGTTTIAKLLEKKIKIPYVYTGDIFRSLAQKHEMSLVEFGFYAEKHPEIDNELDEQQLTLLQKGNVILEGRLAGWIAHKNQIPATKIMLIAETAIRAKRIVQREGGDVKNQADQIQIREQSEKKRYKKYYDIDSNNLSIYDIVIDTSTLTPDEIVQKILDKKIWRK
jgi:predicted cytidylate kinase